MPQVRETGTEAFRIDCSASKTLFYGQSSRIINVLFCVFFFIVNFFFIEREYSSDKLTRKLRKIADYYAQYVSQDVRWQSTPNTIICAKMFG